MARDRIRAREPMHDLERWSVGTIEHVRERDGHCIFEVQADSGETVELAVTAAI